MAGDLTSEQEAGAELSVYAEIKNPEGLEEEDREDYLDPFLLRIEGGDVVVESVNDRRIFYSGRRHHPTENTLRVVFRLQQNRDYRAEKVQTAVIRNVQVIKQLPETP